MFETNDKLRNLPLARMQEDQLIPAVSKQLVHLQFSIAKRGLSDHIDTIGSCPKYALSVHML